MLPNKRYKTLVFNGLFERSAPHQIRCNWTGKVARNPQLFNTAERWGKC